MKLTELLEGRDLTNKVTVPVLVNTDAAERVVAAERDLEKAKAALERASQAEAGRMSQPDTAEAREAVEAAEAALEDARREAEEHLYDFVIRSIGASEWHRLQTDHPPTKEQRDRFGRDLDYNPDTFPVAVLAVCLADPEVASVAEVEQLRGRLPQAVWQQLWGAALRVNLGANRVPLSMTGSGATASSGAR
jgi:hypothetical protein